MALNTTWKGWLATVSKAACLATTQSKAVRTQQAAAEVALADLKKRAHGWIAKLQSFEKSLGGCLSSKGIDICCRFVLQACYKVVLKAVIRLLLHLTNGNTYFANAGRRRVSNIAQTCF